MTAPAPFDARQRRVINSPGVTLEGIDARNRPVVSMKARWGSNIERWALSQSGDPLEITEPVRPVSTRVT